MVRLAARSRLALLHTGLVLAAGAVLVTLTYVLMRRNLNDRPRMLAIIGSPDAPSPIPADGLAALENVNRLHAETLSQLLTQSLIALAIVTVLAAVLGWLLAGRVLRPIQAISATAQRLSAENLSERVPVTAPADELATLAQTVNGMLDRIQSGITEQEKLLHSLQMFVANAAHELRTPLTTMRTAIDVTLDGQPSTEELLVMTGDVRTAVEHSQRTLDGLLTLARSHTGPSRQHPIDLADVVAGIADASRAQAKSHHVELRTDLRPSPIVGDPVLIDRMVINLVDNAIRYNETGGTIAITTQTTAEHAQLRVTNTGQRIQPDTAAQLFEPFVRGTTNQPRTDGGAGLGLSIVRAVVDAHHGQLSSSAPETGGLDITIRIPTPLR
ncbi:ATP-binding protein [Plantactinospora mayteni]|uniref:histidine kinase n=1 Tax=Plantactinospora mayteni TaxID=566021 RepID=A0ABQ4F2P1_9ACTN|nr:HAMP domain-containing sensor histidine kinase [Plantactinospora mayteni]GIH01178.1 two-component sensor histidine kinase [Plantactinospora mayteni]